MIVNICSKALQAGRLTEDNFHRAHSLFACLNIFLGCTVISTCFIICFYLFDFFGVEIGYLTGSLDKTKETPKIQRKIDASTVNLKNVNFSAIYHINQLVVL